MKQLVHNNTTHALGIHIAGKISYIAGVPARIARPNPHTSISVNGFFSVGINTVVKLIIIRNAIL